MITVVIADDQPLIRSGLIQLLAHTDDIQVVGEAGDGAEAVALVQRLRPDVAIMDIRMPKKDGIAATAEIAAFGGPTRVLVLTTFEDDEYVAQALKAGASGFIGKGSEPDEIARAVRLLHEGDALLSPRAARAMIDRYLAQSTGPAATTVKRDLAILTAREREVLRLVALGQSNDDIARSLGISSATVKTHVNRMMPKLDAHDRAQLVIVAYQAGLVSHGG